MPYTCTFLVFLLGKHQSIYCHLSKEIMYPSGIGYNIINQQRKIWQKRTKISQFIIDETLIRVGREVVWLWIAIEPKSKSILNMRISLERSILVAEQLLQELIKKYGKNPVSTDGGTCYPQACRFLKLRHHTHSYYERSIIERTIQYIKDRTECFDDYFPCQKDNCTLEHVRNWFNLFVDVHNSMVVFAK